MRVLVNVQFSRTPSPLFPLMLKSRAICRLTRPPLVVMYKCTIPPALRAQAPPSGPIRRISVRWSVRAQLSCTLPPRPGAVELYTSYLKVKGLAASQAGNGAKQGLATLQCLSSALRP